MEQKECEYENRSAWCYRFFHTLGSAKDIGNSPENSYLFWIEQKTGKILQKQIDCQLNGIDQPSETCVVRKTLEIRHSDDLDSEIRNLIESFFIKSRPCLQLLLIFQKNSIGVLQLHLTRLKDKIRIIGLCGNLLAEKS